MFSPKKRGSFLSFLAWWKADPDEIDRQVSNYATLKLWQSARGISLLLCAFSVALTVLLGAWLLNYPQSTIVSEAVIWGFLGLAMFRGHRWAFITGMVLWTFEKGFLFFTETAAGRAAFGQLVFWAIYMGAFMLGLRVENARRRKAKVVVAQAV